MCVCMCIYTYVCMSVCMEGLQPKPENVDVKYMIKNRNVIRLLYFG